MNASQTSLLHTAFLALVAKYEPQSKKTCLPGLAKQACSAKMTSKNIEILHVASLFDLLFPDNLK